jgi:capsular polysaccharide biosynthesis protein
VDFWDLTKLLARRWVIVLPMLAVSALLAVLTVGQVKPDYVATAYVQLVPPVLEQTKPNQATPDQRNPWLGLGLQTIGNAAVVTVQDKSVVDGLKAAGLSETFTLTMATQSPLVTFEIVGQTAQQARQTAEQLVARFTQSVATLQSAYGVSPADSITARRLDLGTNVVMSSSKVKRALVAVVGAGILMTAGVTVGVDAWLRRRRRRDDLGGQAGAPETPSLPPAPVSSWVLPATSASGVASRPRPNGDNRMEVELAATAIPVGNGPVAGGVNGKDGGMAGLNAEKTQPISPYLLRSMEAAAQMREAEQVRPVPSDATIVLPVSMPLPSERNRWLGRGGKKKRP